MATMHVQSENMEVKSPFSIHVYLLFNLLDINKPSTTFPSESVLQAFISPDELSAEYISKQYWREIKKGLS